MDADGANFRRDTVGAWSEHVKLDVPRRYLPEYTKIMARQRRWCVGGFHYVDAFAGTGSPLARGEDRVVKGSPRIALDLAQPFDSYTLIERDPTRAARLRELRAAYPARRVRVIQDDCNAAILREVTPVVRAERFARGFAFLDPFALELRYDTVRALAETGAFEVVLNLSTMAMNRAGLLNDPDAMTEAHRRRMDLAWGDRSWFDLIYRRRDTLFGPRTVKAWTTGAEELGRLYARHRLAPIFGHVGDPLVVRNAHGQPIYVLLFAGPNATGARIAKHVFGAVARPATPPAPPPAATLPLFD